MKKGICAMALACLMALPLSAWAHGGGLDGYGCHHDRKHGGYHCHRGPLAGESFPSKDAMLRRLEILRGAEDKDKARTK